jgi:hypothetical protein
LLLFTNTLIKIAARHISAGSFGCPTKPRPENHMIYLCIIFMPPLYFLIRKKWGGFILNSILYGLACLCILSMIGIWVAPFFWILSVGHASFTYRREMVANHAEMLATKMAEKMAEALRENKKS